MTGPRLGLAVIINNVHGEYPGSRADVATLEHTYSTIGFTVQVYRDCSGQVSEVGTGGPDELRVHGGLGLVL